MVNGTLSATVVHSLLYFFVPCPHPEQLRSNNIDIQQFLGKWYFQLAVSHKEAHIGEYNAIDSFVITAEETAQKMLLLTGHVRKGDTCTNQTWTYRIRPESNDFELEGRPQRWTLLWESDSKHCKDCIRIQEIEPPLDSTGSEDSLGRHLVFARKKKDDSEITPILESLACHGLKYYVKPDQKKEFCT
ncbi:apolipoprotein M [Scomber scombrus]|uniref:apolipoprotein M n=1 Tax=Scomber scombrus TaxID=13677 RepID=UPI002DD80F1D|nr:apolipoprotein M [Scomber scombrus]